MVSTQDKGAGFRSQISLSFLFAFSAPKSQICRGFLFIRWLEHKLASDLWKQKHIKSSSQNAYILQTDKCKPMISLWSCSSLWATRLSWGKMTSWFIRSESYFLKYVLWISIRWAEMSSPLGILHKLKAENTWRQECARRSRTLSGNQKSLSL